MNKGSSKLIYFLIFVIAGSLILVNLAVNFFWLGTFIDKIEQRALGFEIARAKRISYVVENFVNYSVVASENIAYSIRLEGEKSVDTEIILSRFLRDNPDVKTISIIDSGGMEIKRYSVSRFFQESDLKNLSLSEEFEGAINGKIFFSHVFFSENSEPYIVIAVPVLSLDQQKVMGVVRTELSLKGVWSLVSGMDVGAGGRVSVVDNKGNLVADPDPSRVLKRESLVALPTVKAVIEGIEFKDLEKGRYSNEAGVDVIGVSVPVEKLGWGVIIEQPEEEIIGQAQQLQQFAIIFILASIIVGIVLIGLAGALRKSSRELMDRFNQLEAQRNQLDKTAKLLVRRDFELMQANELLQEMDEVRSQFIATAAHQLRTPLSAMRWTIQMILSEDMGKISSDVKVHLEKIFESNNRLISLMNTLLNAARIEEGRFLRDLKKVSLKDLLKDTVDYSNSLALEQQIKIKFDVPKTDFPKIKADVEKLKLAFQNVFNNSIKYSKPGGKIVVNLKHTTECDERNCFLIEIKDSGIGISQEDQKRVFTKFFRAEDAMKFNDEGTGLGLFITKNIIEAHGGKIWFASVKNKGTTFYIKLPVDTDKEREVFE